MMVLLIFTILIVGLLIYFAIEKIAEEFAIGFAQWIEKYQGGTPNLKVLKELLEIYKKEKGL